MNIYKLETEHWGWDCYKGHIIASNNMREAIKLAQDKSAGEGKKIWEDCEIKRVGKSYGIGDKPIILLSSFKAG